MAVTGPTFASVAVGGFSLRALHLLRLHYLTLRQASYYCADRACGGHIVDGRGSGRDGWTGMMCGAMVSAVFPMLCVVFCVYPTLKGNGLIYG